MNKSILLVILAGFITLLIGCHAGGEAPYINRETEFTPVIAEGLPKITVKGETNLPGHFFISFPFTRNLIMMDGKGNIIWSKHEPVPATLAISGLWDFKKHIIGGQSYFSYHDRKAEFDNFGLAGFGPGERVILDSKFNEIKRITFEQSEVTEKGHPLDGHDFIMIDLNNYILSGYIKKTVDNVPNIAQSSVVYSYLQEVQNGAVIWDWKSIDYPELYGLSVTDADANANDFENTFTDSPDYVHFNSMRIDADENLVCSFRHLNSIICLDRHKNTNQILWKLSGNADDFHLAENEKTSCQHYAVIDKDSISVFDNGNKLGQSYIRSYKLNTGNKTAQVKTLTVPGKFSSACGSAQRITGETYVIGWGKTENDAVCMSVYDFATNNELMSITLEVPQNFTYRCVYYE